MQEFADSQPRSGLVSSEAAVGTPWQQSAARLLPRIKESVEELIKMGQKFTNPLQNFAVVSIVQDRDDPSVPAAEVVPICGMAILRVFNTEKEAKDFCKHIASKGYRTPTFVIPMGKIGRFPPPANLTKEYHDPTMNRLMERYKHMANAATDHIQARITAMREKQDQEHADALKREEALRKKLSELEEKKQTDPSGTDSGTAAAAEALLEEHKKEEDQSIARLKEYEYEASRLEKELQLQREQAAKEAEIALVTHNNKPVEIAENTELLKVRFAEEVKDQTARADRAFLSRAIEAKRAGQPVVTEPSPEHAVNINTCAGVFRYIPHKGYVVDQALLAADAHLRKHDIIDPGILKARFRSDVVKGFGQADAVFAQKAGNRKPTEADAVEIETVAGKIGYVPHHGPVLDDRLMATDQFLQKHGLPPVYGKEYTTSSTPPPAGSKVVDITPPVGPR